jgi:hypothetical protein
MRILLYMWGRISGEQLFCTAVKKCHKRDLPAMLFCMQYHMRNKKFIGPQIEIFERIINVE